MTPVSVSRTELARNTREIVDQVRHGQPVVVQSYGEEQIVLLDVLDYRLLRAIVAYALALEPDQDGDTVGETIRLYLDERISLSKAAEQLDLSRFDLMDRFERLGVPLRIGSATLDEARNEVAAAQHGKNAAR